MYTGTVVIFSPAKGWGFISPEGGGPDMFVHHTKIDMEGYRKLEVGQRVTYDVEQGPSGKPQACQVRVIGG